MHGLDANLLLEPNAAVAARDLLKFVMKFQQYTPPVMAKGYEDTSLYQYNRLVSLNDVGGDPRHFGNSVNARLWPSRLTACFNFLSAIP